ncbi:MAG: hypothetical protein IPK53_09825 [bacterium]|nr:hypothetical protein [bacterium]
MMLPSEAVSVPTIACTNTKLELALQKAGYAVTADVSQDVPLITTTFNEANRRFVEQGGRVLFLAETPDALQTVVPRLSLATRAGTAWAGGIGPAVLPGIAVICGRKRFRGTLFRFYFLRRTTRNGHQFRAPG